MRKQLLELWTKKDDMKQLFHNCSGDYCTVPYVYDVPEFIEWQQAVLYELELISKVNTSTFIKDTIELIRDQWDGWSDDDNFNQLIAKLKVIVNDFELEEESETKKIKPPKLFISHSTEDQNCVKKLVELFEDIGLDDKMMFCSSYVGYDIPLGEDIYHYLENQFSEYNVQVLFVLSDAYYRSAASLNEMGASWILQKQYSSILLPRFEFRDIRGVINPRKVALKLDNPLEDVKNKLGQLKEKLINDFGLNQMASHKWERKRDQFIEEIAKIDPHIELSEDEMKLLSFMSEDQFGQVLISESLDGTKIGNSCSTLVNCRPREVVKWRSIIKQLEEKEYIEAKNLEKTLYAISDKGYLLIEDK